MNPHKDVAEADNAGCFCDKHWSAMCGCGLFNARVWLGCLRSGIELFKRCRLDDAQPQLIKAFVAGKRFFVSMRWQRMLSVCWQIPPRCFTCA